MQQWSYTSLQIISKMSMSLSHLLVHTISLSVYLVHTITRKWDIKFVNDMSSLDYFLYFGYPRVKNFTRALPAGEILYPYPNPRVKFHTHTLTRRVGYPRVKLPSLNTQAKVKNKGLETAKRKEWEILLKRD